MSKLNDKNIQLNGSTKFWNARERLKTMGTLRGWSFLISSFSVCLSVAIRAKALSFTAHPPMTRGVPGLNAATIRDADFVERMVGGECYEMVLLPNNMVSKTVFVGNLEADILCFHKTELHGQEMKEEDWIVQAQNMSTTEEVTVNADGTTIFESSTPPVVGKEAFYNATFEEVVIKRIDSAIYLIIIVLVIGIVSFFVSCHSKKEEDDLFSELNGEKFIKRVVEDSPIGSQRGIKRVVEDSSTQLKEPITTTTQTKVSNQEGTLVVSHCAVLEGSWTIFGFLRFLMWRCVRFKSVVLQGSWTCSSSRWELVVLGCDISYVLARRHV
jgi:hypothetical protein